MWLQYTVPILCAHLTISLATIRFLVKKQQEDRALAVLTKVYKDEGRARSQLKEIRSNRNVGKAPFSETFKFVLQWNNLQRYITTNTNGVL